jgi:hypothetical protein
VFDSDVQLQKGFLGLVEGKCDVLPSDTGQVMISCITNYYCDGFSLMLREDLLDDARYWFRQSTHRGSKRSTVDDQRQFNVLASHDGSVLLHSRVSICVRGRPSERRWCPRYSRTRRLHISKPFRNSSASSL